MLKNYIKIALRALWRDRNYSLINLLGLAVGLASVLVILAYVRYELSYDKHYSNSPNIYRLIVVNKVNKVDETDIRVPAGLATVLKKEFPAVKAYSLLANGSVKFKQYGEMVNMQTIEGTADFFKLFNFKFISGQPEIALKEQRSIVLTETAAKKYFPGVANPIGKTIYCVDEARSVKVTAVIKDIPANTHFSAEAIRNMVGDKMEHEALDLNGYSSVPEYVFLNPGTNVIQFEDGLKSIYKRYHFPPEMHIKLQPVTSIHLHSHAEDEIAPNGDIKYIYIFSSVAVLILLIACINYINLTTARSLQRGREIGVRKVLGAVKKQLIVQFLSESFLFFTICLLVGVLLAYTFWPPLAGLISNNSLSITLFDGWSVLLMLAIALIFGLISGMYPALFLSKINTAQVLKGVNKFGVNISLRKILVAIQFVISGVLIISTLVIHQQLQFINNARLGFNKEHLITVPFFTKNSHIDAFKNELKNSPSIVSVSVASWETGVHFGGWGSMPDQNDTTKTVKVQFVSADPDFIKTMGIKILKGRDFSRSNASDMFNIDSAAQKVRQNGKQFLKVLSTQSIILNEEALKVLDLKYSDNQILNRSVTRGTIVGLAQNFNGLSLHEKIPAVVITCSPKVEFGQMYIRIAPGNTQQTIAFIQKKWTRFYPENRFDFVFVDQKLQKLYSADKRVGDLFGAFACLAIVIACLGLFGLISLTVQQRVKEIGIRKVLGASVANIAALLSTDFLKLVVLSMVIASPIAWYAMNKWLQDFAYRIEVHWWVFALAGVAALLIALLTVSVQSIKAALTNPVKSLRSE